ncbi:MAG: PorT family protein [Flavobacterium sp.]|nr:MAG: PorT family protein [Flavobacterium sp.]
MKKLLLLLFGLTANKTISQTLSYGVLLGVNVSASASKDGDSFLNDSGATFTNSGNYVVPSFGAYAEYNFTERWGLKTEVLLHKATLEANYNPEGQLKMNILEISPNVKFDFGNEYRKGAYLVFGPRITLLNKISYEGSEADQDFTKTLIGLQLGAGTRILDYFDLQFKLNYDFTPFYENPTNTNSDFFLGANLHLGIDIERLLHQNK